MAVSTLRRNANRICVPFVRDIVPNSTAFSIAASSLSSRFCASPSSSSMSTVLKPSASANSMLTVKRSPLTLSIFCRNVCRNFSAFFGPIWRLTSRLSMLSIPFFSDATHTASVPSFADPLTSVFKTARLCASNSALSRATCSRRISICPLADSME